MSASKDDDMTRKIREAAAEGRITYASSDNIDDYEEIGADFIETIFGIKAYMISDLSTLSDFASCCFPAAATEPDDYHEFSRMCQAEMVSRIENVYHITVDPHDLLIDVFEKIRRLHYQTLQ